MQSEIPLQGSNACEFVCQVVGVQVGPEEHAPASGRFCYYRIGGEGLALKDVFLSSTKNAILLDSIDNDASFLPKLDIDILK